jgi:hypothetical protein
MLLAAAGMAQEPIAQLDVRVHATALAPGEVARLDITSSVDLTSLWVSVPWHPVVPFKTTPRTWEALIGLDLASIMGDEIRDPQRTLPGAVA